MEKIDKRIKYLVGLDTETCNGLLIDGKSDLSQSLVYDLGYVITDKRGKIYLQRSFVIYDFFVGYRELMESAYYKNKIPMYDKEIKDGTRKLVRFSTARKYFIEDCKKYNVTTAFAHNTLFDLNALNNSIRYLTKSKYRYFFPYGMELWDTLKMSKDTICKQKAYVKFCQENGYMTKTGKPQAKAETLYRYITNDTNFIESHTGLEDVVIESQILAKCFQQHKKMRKLLFEN